ncbi:unnamed protein product [Merluccius merluccius]
MLVCSLSGPAAPSSSEVTSPSSSGRRAAARIPQLSSGPVDNTHRHCHVVPWQQARPDHALVLPDTYEMIIIVVETDQWRRHTEESHYTCGGAEKYWYYLTCVKACDKHVGVSDVSLTEDDRLEGCVLRSLGGAEWKQTDVYWNHLISLRLPV